MKTIYLFVAAVFVFTSCLTGGFDQNEQLEELEEAQAYAPKIEAIYINGEELERNTQSIRVVEAAINETLEIKVDISSGKKASLETVEFLRVYYYGESFEGDPMPVDPDSDDGIYEVSGDSYELNYTYIVPEEDDDGDSFEAGYTIRLYIKAKNDRDNYAYNTFEIHLVE